MKKNNSDIERYYFKLFQECYKLPNGTISHGDKPDTIISTGQSIVGIEVTNFYITDGSENNSEQKQAPLRQIVLELAQKKYKEFGCKNIKAHIGFNEITNHKKLAEKIANLMRKFEYFDTGQISQDHYEDITEINFIYINTGEIGNSAWEACQVYSGSFLNIEHLKQVISKKEEKAKDYNKACNEYWLLIVIDFINRGQDQELTNVDIPQIESEVFSKIIIFKTVYNQIIELL